MPVVIPALERCVQQRRHDVVRVPREKLVQIGEPGVWRNRLLNSLNESFRAQTSPVESAAAELPGAQPDDLLDGLVIHFPQVRKLFIYGGWVCIGSLRHEEKVAQLKERERSTFHRGGDLVVAALKEVSELDPSLKQ